MKRVLKWIGIIVGSLLGIVVLVYAVVAVISAGRINRTYEVSADFALSVPDDPERIAEGQRLYTIMCQSCHGENLAGQTFADLMAGRIVIANLTSGEGGIGSNRSDEAIAQAVWYGVKPDGSSTILMPPEFNQAVNLTDMENLIAYIRSVPPVETTAAKTRLGPMMRVMHVTNQFPVVTAEHVALDSPPLSAHASQDGSGLGKQRAAFCTACHGADLTGDPIGGPNITPHETALGTWSQDDFVRALREGLRPDGSAISTEMPCETLHFYTDEELHAMWAYLQTIDPVARDVE